MAKHKTLRNAYLNARFAASVKEFGLALIKTSNVGHTGSKGRAREVALLKFFQDRLPERFSVVEGEAVDPSGNTSPQMDLMFYDRSVNFALSADASFVLPAEALLATIEVKSQLNVTEIQKSVTAARKLRKLRPFDKALAGPDVGQPGPERCRYFHCVFAYSSNLTTDWMHAECARLAGACQDEHLIDFVYVLEKGLVHLTSHMVRPEDKDGGAITELYFSILNFIQREAGRRKSVPLDRYTKPATKWVKMTGTSVASQSSNKNLDE